MIPRGILNQIRLRCKLSVFLHDPKPQIEKYASKLEWEPNTLFDDESQSMQGNSGKDKQVDQKQVVTVNKEAEIIHKRSRKKDSFTGETIQDKRFRIPYNKKSKLTNEERDKEINADDKNGHQTNDEATLIVNETLKELQDVQF